MDATIRRESDRDREFSTWVTRLPGAETLEQCIHCGQCAGSCPLSTYMDRSPRQLLYLAKEGFKDEVLGSFTLWLCTSCYTCTVKCPRAIKVTDVLYALKRRSIEEGVYSRRFPIPVLAQEFRDMVRAHGRINEVRLAMNLNLKTRPTRMLGMAGLGLGLMRTGRFSLRYDNIRGRDQLGRLLGAVDRRRAEKRQEVAA
jgi:heterodisulfide reductase subunit C/quinone-modifying oxidoreductase subunit QmoC